MLENLMITLKISGIFLFVFCFIPLKLLPQPKDIRGLDKVFFNLFSMTFITLVLVHLLVLLRIYEFISLIMGYIFVFSLIWVCKWRGIPISEIKRRSISVTTRLLDILECEIDLRGRVIKFSRKVRDRLSLALEKISIEKTLFSLSCILLFAYAAYLRFFDSFHHKTFGTSEPYFHLKLLKYLELNKLFVEGIFPEGFSVFLSLIHKFTFLDPAHVIRFTGPVVSLGIVATIFFTTLRMTGNKWAGFISAFIYGTFTTLQFPSEFYRQTTTLPQEFGMLFILPTLLFLWQGLKTKRCLFLLPFFEGLVIMLRVYPLCALVTTFGVIISAIVAFGLKESNKTFMVSLLKGYPLAVGIGVLPMVVGLLEGVHFHPATLNVITIFATQTKIMTLSLTPLTWGVLGTTFFVLFYSLFHPKGKNLTYLCLSLFLVWLFLEYNANYFGIRHLMVKFRTGCFISLISPVVIGVFFQTFLHGNLQRLRRFYPIGPLAIVCVLGVLYPGTPPVPFKMEYEGMMKAYFKITKLYPPLKWLIVSHVEEYPLVLTKGWHMNTEDFLQRFNAVDGIKKLETPYIFIFTEKRPFSALREIHPELYRKRELAQIRLKQWCQVYSLHHSNMSLFYEDKDVAIYLIHNPQPNELSLRMYRGARRCQEERGFWMKQKQSRILLD